MGNTPEQDIKNSILEYLSFRKDCFVFIHDSTGIFDPIKKIYRRRNSRHAMKGVSDIIGIWSGKPLAIEVKSKNGCVSPEQRYFLLRWTEMGGVGFIARSVEDVVNNLK